MVDAGDHFKKRAAIPLAPCKSNGQFAIIVTKNVHIFDIWHKMVESGPDQHFVTKDQGFGSARCSLLRAEDSSFNLGVLYGGLGTSKICNF
jgi:hypothetical protein